MLFKIDKYKTEVKAEAKAKTQTITLTKTNPYLVSAGECIICVTNLPRYLVIQATVKTSFLILVVIK